MFVEETLKDESANVDYSGARAKTDPMEIALVRKLDWWIMPILWFMYWLNYLVRHTLLSSYVAANQSIGSQCYRPCQA